MPRLVDGTPRGAQVNVVKKVRIDKGWRLCPVVREPNGRLRDRVRVNDHIEGHPEGVYYIERREDGRRLREAAPNSAVVLERARLKSLELEAGRVRQQTEGTPIGSDRVWACFSLSDETLREE
jgi:hypothetical protein